jgi:hypothetical protein
MKSNGWQMLSRAQQQQHLLFNKIIPAPTKHCEKKAIQSGGEKTKGRLQTNVYGQKGIFATCTSLAFPY